VIATQLRQIERSSADRQRRAPWHRFITGVADYRPIDFGFYRKQAAALRSQAKRNAFKSKVAFRLAMISLAVPFIAALVTLMQSQLIQSAWI